MPAALVRIRVAPLKHEEVGDLPGSDFIKTKAKMVKINHAGKRIIALVASLIPHF